MTKKTVDEFPRVSRIITAQGTGSCWQEDIASIRRRWIAPGDRWTTPASASGMRFIRQPARVLSLGFCLEDGHVAWGDCLSVSFAGKSGRDGAFDGGESITRFLSGELHDILRACAGRKIHEVESTIRERHPELASSVLFGISQALVNAVVINANVPAHTVLRHALGPDIAVAQMPQKIEFQGSCGSNWHDAVERMIVAGVKYLPQGQFEDLEREIGHDGRQLLEYINWLKGRFVALGPASASPVHGERVITLDFHGALGDIFGHDTSRIADYVVQLEAHCKPYRLHVESPVVMATFDDQVNRLASLREALRQRQSSVRIIADEWANTLAQMEKLASANAVDGIHIKMPDTGSILDSGRAVALCRRSRLFCILGGSCTETANSSTLAVHLAAATAPDALLIKPGISFDEGFSLVSTELARIQSASRSAT